MSVTGARSERNSGDELPWSREAERAVLGAVLLEPSTFLGILPLLRDSDFFLPQHRLVYRAMEGLVGSAKPIDTVMLVEFLRASDELDATGGPGFISSLPDGLPKSANLVSYIKIIRNASTRRKLLYAAQSLQEKASLPGSDVAALIKAVKTDLDEIGNSANATADWAGCFHTFEEFESTAPLSFAIAGFLQNQGATMIGGLSGHGKTLIALSIVKALLKGRGSKLWDLFTVEEDCQRVVYLIPECAISPFKYRLKLFGLYDYLGPDNAPLLVRTLSKGAAPSLTDERILLAAKDAHVVLDTATRFSEGDENLASDNQRGLASDIFALLTAGARSVLAIHHSPKPFARENSMSLEGVLRGSGDIGAMLSTGWGIKQLDPERNVIHIENIKPRDFEPVGPFQLIGRPYLDTEGDFRILKKPGECGRLSEEQPERDKGGGAPQAVREARAANLALMRGWLQENPNLTSPEIVRRFANEDIKITDSTIRKYRKQLNS